MDPVAFAWLEELPQDLLGLSAVKLFDKLGGPTAIALPGPDGSRDNPLVVAALLHGNETSGWEVIRGWLAEVDGKPPCPLVIVLGNLAAASENQRNLDLLQDHNRCWTNEPHTPLEHACAKLYNRIAALSPFLAIDIHNTNGSNPCHAVYAKRYENASTRNFASMFADDVICTGLRYHTFMEAFAALCPAITLECGTSEDPGGLAQADRFLRQIAAKTLTPNPQARFYQIVERIELADEAKLGLAGGDGDVILPADSDRNFNFVELQQGTVLATLNGQVDDLLRIIDVSNSDQREGTISGFLTQQGDKLVVARQCTPALIVCDADLVKQDCLCYLMIAQKSARSDPASEEFVQMGSV